MNLFDNFHANDEQPTILMRANKNKSIWLLRGDLDSQTSKFSIQNPSQPPKHQVHPWHLERRIKDWTFEREIE